MNTTAVRTDSGISGIFCAMCGSRMYLSKDGQRKCPNCDDAVEMRRDYTHLYTGV